MIPDGKVSIGSYPLVYPIPLVLLGANVAGEPNYSAVGNCAIGGFNPGLVFVSSVRHHYTNQGIVENGSFSVNFPTTGMVEVADFCGLVSGREYDKGRLFGNFYGQLGTAPMIEECPVALECKVVHEYTHGEMQMFVGEVVNAYVDRRLAVRAGPPGDGGPAAPTGDDATGAGDTNRGAAQGLAWRFGRASLADLAPIMYHLDNRYYQAGEAIGHGFEDGEGVECPRRGGHR